MKILIPCAAVIVAGSAVLAFSMLGGSFNTLFGGSPANTERQVSTDTTVVQELDTTSIELETEEGYVPEVQSGTGRDGIRITKHNTIDEDINNISGGTLSDYANYGGNAGAGTDMSKAGTDSNIGSNSGYISIGSSAGYSGSSNINSLDMEQMQNTLYSQVKGYIDSKYTEVIQGAKGEKGDKGDKGDRGPQGMTGAQGATGQQGKQGAIGQQGATGKTGETGAQGKQGVKGDKGETGDSAYLIAVELGYAQNPDGTTMTKDEWVKSLNGPSAYEIAKTNGTAYKEDGTIMTEGEWISSLKGQEGIHEIYTRYQNLYKTKTGSTEGMYEEADFTSALIDFLIEKQLDPEGDDDDEDTGNQ